MQLWLTHEQIRQITHHAIEGVPCEVCGLITGINNRVQQIIPVDNVAEHPEHTYYMDERTLIQTLKQLDKTGQTLLGIYHSHPNSDAIPSQTDIDRAYYPNTAYVIVSLKHEKPHLQAWEIHQGQVSPVELHVGEVLPDQFSEHKLSNAQKNAIIISAIVALLLMLIISFSLLPPAPELSSIVGS